MRTDAFLDPLKSESAGKRPVYICSEPFTQTAHRLDRPGPFTRQNIECMGQVNGNEAHLLDDLSRFGPERLFSQPHAPPLTNYGVRRRNPHTLRSYSNFP